MRLSPAPVIGAGSNLLVTFVVALDASSHRVLDPALFGALPLAALILVEKLPPTLGGQGR
jgi:hypothetical protein